MNKINVTKENFEQTVQATLRVCNDQLEYAKREPINYDLVRDLSYALDALLLIEAELQGKKQRPIGQRSCPFTRYVIDEENRMVINAELKDMIVQIESFYTRY